MRSELSQWIAIASFALAVVTFILGLKGHSLLKRIKRTLDRGGGALQHRRKARIGDG